MAVPAKPGLLSFAQSDGTEVKVRLVGDESNHQYFSEDGYLLTMQEGDFYYAGVSVAGIPVNSGIRYRAERSSEAQAFLATVDKEATLRALDRAAGVKPAKSPMRGPGLFPETRFPGMGDQKALVVLVEYTDVKFKLSDPHDYFSRMLNESGFSDYNGTGSAVDFFLESSAGQFRPQFDVCGPITLSNKQSYYGGNDWYGNDNNPEMMVIEACQQLDETVDFTQYDRDNDGYIDNVFVFYAGRGEASGGAASTVWPHSWTVSAVHYEPYYFDGVRLDRYACSNEWEDNRPDGVGTFVHEFSHVMGLPDLYATSYTSAFTPGSWSCMDYGPYNNDGCTPPLYGAFERYALGWMEPLALDRAMSATLPPISENVAGIVKSNSENEYFLFENRQQTGWDAYIPGHGMLVWHIDYNTSVWDSNKVNNTPMHQYVDIEEADGTQSEYSRAGDAFPGTSNVTSFTGETNPAMRTWAGVRLQYPITNIKESTDGIITFDVLGGRTVEAPAVREAQDITPDSFVACWGAEEPAQGMARETEDVPSHYLLTVYTKDEDGNAMPLEGLNRKNVGPVKSYLVENVEPQTDYYYTVAACYGLQTSADSEEMNVFTGRPGIDRLTVTATDAENVLEDEFTATWEKLPEATEYILTVYEHVYGAPFSDMNSFDDGVEHLTGGWKSTSVSGYSMASYCGNAVPSLRMGRAGDILDTPVYDDRIRGFRFWCRGSGTRAEDAAVIYAHTADGWTKLAEYEIVKSTGGQTIELTEELIPEDADAMRIQFSRTGASGSLAVDDVEVLYGITYADEVLPEYENLLTGDVDNYTVTGLKPETDYRYTVAATDGELVSHASALVDVKTKKASAVDTVVSATLAVKAVNGTVTVSGAMPGDTVTVTDLAGRNVAVVDADTAGNATVTGLASGVYIVKCNNLVVKLYI